MLYHHMMKLVILVLCINSLVKSQPLESTSKQVRQVASAKSPLSNPFAPNAAIFKIPVFKTVNLDFRNANATKIQSELVTTMKGLLQNKALKQEKLILNVKPPKKSNTTFVKNFTTLLKNETSYLVPDAVVGAQSTIFKKKSGEINTLRITLYIIRQEKKIPVRKPLKKVSHPDALTEKASINMTKTENITATLESVLRHLHENTTDNGEIERTNIFLSLISSKNFTSSQISSLRKSIRQISSQLYPDSNISIQAKLFYKKKTHVSRLEFEIDVQPRLTKIRTTKKLPLKELKRVKEAKTPLISSIQLTTKSLDYNETKPTIKSITINGTNTVENTTSSIEFILVTLFKNITGKTVNTTNINVNILSPRNLSRDDKKSIEHSIDQTMHKTFPGLSISLQTRSQYNPKQNISLLNLNFSMTSKYRAKKSQEAMLQKLNLTVISPNEILQDTLSMLRKDLQKLIPDSQLLVQARKVISKDLSLLTKALEYPEKEPKKMKISMDLTKIGSNFDVELNKILPRILAIAKGSLEPITLAFRIVIPSSLERDISSDVCSIMKTLTNKIPSRTRFGSLDLEVTILPKFDQLIANRSDEKIAAVLADIKSELKAESRMLPHMGNTTLHRLLNLTEPGVNITRRLNKTLEELAKHISHETIEKEKQFNISLIIPQNETKLLVENILEILRKDIKVLFPYSRILIETQDLIAKSLRILKLNVRLKTFLDHEDKKVDVIPIDLSQLGKNVPGELEAVLKPLWSEVKKNSPTSFDLKLRPVNDIKRGLLSNDICSIVDILTRSLPEGISLNDIIFQTTVLPDHNPEIEKHLVEEKTPDLSMPWRLVELNNPSGNITSMVHGALEELIKELENDTSAFIQANNFTLAIQLPKNETRESVKELLRMIGKDLSKLAPYADIIINHQNTIENELHTLELDINLEHRNPIKKFRIDLNEFGEFLPDEVDKIVYDIRKSENPFGFALQMSIPEGVDLESANEEICSVSNVVINNIPKESYLTGTVLKITVLPGKENDLNGVRNLPSLRNEDKGTIDTLSKLPKNDNSIRGNIHSNHDIGENLIAPSSNPSWKTVSEGSKMAHKLPTDFSNKTPSLVSKIDEMPASLKITKALQAESPSFFRTPESSDDRDPKKSFLEMASEHEESKTTPSYEVNSKLSSSDEYDETATSNCVEEDWQAYLSTSPNPVSEEESTNSQHESESLPDEINKFYNQQAQPLKLKTPEEDNRNENGESNYRPTDENELEEEPTLSELKNNVKIQSNEKSPLSKAFQVENDSLMPVRGHQTENHFLLPERLPNIVTKTDNIPRKHSYPEDTDEIENLLKKQMPPSLSIPQIKSETENIPLVNAHPENTEDVEDFSGKMPRSVNKPHVRSEIRHIIPSANLYSGNGKIKSFLQRRKPFRMNKPDIESENGMIPMKNSYPENTEDVYSYLQKRLPKTMGRVTSETENIPLTTYSQNSKNIRSSFRSSLPQINSKTENIPLKTLYPENTKETKEGKPNDPKNKNIPPAILNPVNIGESFTQDPRDQTELEGSSTAYPENTSGNDQVFSVNSKTLSSPKTKSVNIRRYRKNVHNLNSIDDESKSEIPNWDLAEEKSSPIPKLRRKEIKSIPIEAFNNDQNDILQYIDYLNLTTSSIPLDETILNLTISVVNIVPRTENETLELILNIIPPSNTTVYSLKNITNSVLSSLVSSLPNDIVNIETNVVKNKNNVIIHTQMKITVSNNNNIRKQIQEKEQLIRKYHYESQSVQNLTEILNVLVQDVKQELNIQNHLKNDTSKKKSLEAMESFLEDSLNTVISKISSTIENSSDSENLNFNFPLSTPVIVSQDFIKHFRNLLRAILIRTFPFKDVTIEANTLNKDNFTSIALNVHLKPRTIFYTPPIDLDDLNILDVESVLTKTISGYISRLGKANVYNKTIIIDFVFETSHISSLNVDNIESAIEDVFNSLKLKGELLTDDIKLRLTKKNQIIINLPYIISTLTDTATSSQKLGRQETTPKPLEVISDMILAI